MKTRLANKEDMTSAYMMGFDVWSEGASEQEYLDGCKASSKYAQGTWYVLEENNKLFSSLITYKFSNSIYGIGSIATPEKLRKRGFASALINNTIDLIKTEPSNIAIFLYSDINYKFYESFGFQKLPDDLQKYNSSTCMVKTSDNSKLFEKFDLEVPKYF